MLTNSTSARPLRIMVLTCSTRPGALGPAVVRWFLGAVNQTAAAAGCELVPVSLADMALPLLDEIDHPSSGTYTHEHTRRWSSAVADVDGFVVALPEYNYGMPAAFKNALDYLYAEWAWKPMGFVSYGNTSAGTRSVQHAKQVTTTLRLVNTGATVALRIAEVTAGGVVTSAPERDSAAAALLEEVVALSRALRPMRIPGGTTVPGVPGATLRPLTGDDAGEVLVLQRCCWLDEARANNTFDVPALQESITDVEHSITGQEWQGWGVWRDSRLIGMVRASRDGDSWVIGRLATAPDVRGLGIASFLLGQAEGRVPQNCTSLSLTTGRASTGNIAYYQARGYEPDPTTSSDLSTVVLTKPRRP